MEDTYCKDHCAFVKCGFAETCKECPNYVETWWQNDKDEPKLIKDCAPKRMMLQLQLLSNQIYSDRVSIIELRNEVNELQTKLLTLFEFISSINNKKEVNSIEDKN